MKTIYEDLNKRFTMSGYKQQRDDLAFVTVDKDQLVNAITYLKDYHKFTHLAFVTAVDWLEENEFQITYLLHNYELKVDLGLKVRLDRDNPTMDTIHHLWKQARVYQRELHEMFGIDFPGSPGVNDPMILESWEGPPPMRRDFDTKKYSEETYDHRERQHIEPEDHLRKQLYPED
ncbi:MAG: NADH-quinone oxidoreductase subunit C [Candidatus Zophobacter franzmannii]|jgi:NADH-quinone oxidoreductase subunit C|nr:NADH-quinone oxidoreductase subunit C [Candidatus Zophobacter franzmannii]